MTPDNWCTSYRLKDEDSLGEGEPPWGCLAFLLAFALSTLAVYWL